MHRKTSGEIVQGALYRIILKDKTVHEGIFVSQSEGFVYIKLSSGYNIGISKESIESAEMLHREKGEEDFSKIDISDADGGADAHKNAHGKNAEIMILHTGGTIASKVDYATGAVNAKFTPEDMLALFPELKSIATIDSRLVRNMWSEDMRLEHYNILAKEIESALKNKSLKGIILTHGTDTMHYTASALSFMFESLPVPVVLVGSQRSSDRPSSDAAMNLLSAAFFISNAKENGANGIFICMHESNDDKYCSILPAQNARKLHSTRRDAFRCVNCNPVARVNFEKREIEILPRKHSSFAQNDGAEPHNHKAKLFNPKIRVGILRSRPGLLPEEFDVYENFDGLILEGTGLGLMPIGYIDEETAPNAEIFQKIKKIAASKVVCITSQTIFGRINMNVYSPGRRLRELGILGHNLNMTTESAYIKLCWLLSNYSMEEAKKLYSENLRGEISQRSEKEEFI